MANNDSVNFTRALLGQGLGMGWGDEAEAWLRSRVGGQPYEKERAAINREYAQFHQRHPLAAPATEFVGGMLPVVGSYLATAASGSAAAPAAAATTARAASTLGKIASSPAARAWLAGVGSGAAAGAGSAEPGSRLEGAKTGGELAGAFGLVLPAAARASQGAYKWLRGRLVPTETFVESEAAGRINRALQEARGGKGMTPGQVERAMRSDVARGVPSVVANVDPALVGLAETVAQRSGKSAQRVGEKLGPQVTGSRQRVYEKVRRAMGGRDYFEDEGKMVEDLRNKAKGVYDEAYNQGEVRTPWVPKIMEILQSPKFKGFYDEARKIADTEALAARMRGEDPSKYMLNDIYLVDQAGNLSLKKAPDVRTLDYIKRGIDATIDKGFRGEGMSKAEASALRDLRREFIDTIDRATVDPMTGVSPYQTARRVYAGDMEVLDALRAGRTDFKALSHQEIERLMGTMSDAEKDAFRTGVLQHVYDTTMNSAQNINAAKRLLAPETMAKLRPLFDTDRKFGLFQSALQRESQLVQHANTILGGAATGRRTQARQRFEEGSEAGQALGDLVTGGYTKSLIGMFGRWMNSAQITDETADRVAKLLMSNDPNEVAAAVKVLEKHGSDAQRSEALTRAAETAGVVGSAAAVQPAPNVETEQRNAEKDLQDLEEPQSGVPERNIEEDLRRLEEEAK